MSLEHFKENAIHYIVLGILVLLIGYYSGVAYVSYREFGWDYCIGVTSANLTTEIICFPTRAERRAYVENASQKTGEYFLNDFDIIVGTGNFS
jgi:hypothetical protein